MISYFYLDKLRLMLFEIGQILKACRLRHFYACGNVLPISAVQWASEPMVNISPPRAL
ncbi:MAG: hypothetical protein ACLTCP_05845 [Ruminococcus bicirculans (ex Wegman et al. 2014)]